MRPKNGCRVVDPSHYVWGDETYLQKRASASINRPISVYEVHLGSWKKNGHFWKNYRELGDELAAYCTKMGFTHVELMPVCEHPLDESWGYQVSGYFAPTSRYGSFEDFQYFVDILHQHDIGVILDWVPGHFPTDDFALARFDGTALYEHEDRRQGWHPHWNTFIFNYGRKEIANFLIASALSWLDFFHIDGLRVDAVASMLYLDYGREGGQWIPNCYGGKENLEAIEFLRHANSVIHSRYPGVLMIAEESTSFAGVSHPLKAGGLGFDMKWNMGWMNDSLRYFQRDPIFRTYHQNDLTFNLLYAFSEKFISVLSHDEVVHGKRSLLSKMPGDYWQKFANLRLLISYMMCQPGKKLLFMGAEVGQWDEWNCKGNIAWDLLRFPQHQGLQNCVQDLNRFYRTHEALYADDFSYQGFEWVDFNDSQNSIISYLRKVPGSHKALYCIHNFTPTYFERYYVPLRHVSHIQEVFNTDDVQYGGSGKAGLDAVCHRDGHGHYNGATIAVPPLATTIFEVTWA
jgi:1,4-alpha-glucan branching enzyme